MVTVFGLGFVGLTTALGFAHLGYQVYGVEANPQRREQIGNGELPFLEPGMDAALQEHLGQNFLVTGDPKEAIAQSEYIFYCVGTPYGEEGAADLTDLFQAIDTTASAITDDRFRVLVTKSTIPPGTTAEQIRPYVQKKGSISRQLGIANNPEFLREGKCWEDFLHADRIVLGCSDPVSEGMLRKLYAPMGIPMFCVSPTTGEFIKYLSNTLLATLISYANEMAEAADVFGDIDAAKAFRILHMDKRWGGCQMTSYVYPGCGYGGYCLPKDTCAFHAQARKKGYAPRILGEVISVNAKRFSVMAEKITKGLAKDRTIGILGLSFKPDSDDVRDTPAAKIIGLLQEQGYTKLLAYDPAAMEVFARQYPHLTVTMAESAGQVCREADVLAILTAWEEFRQEAAGTDKPIIDCRYMLTGAEIERPGAAGKSDKPRANTGGSHGEGNHTQTGAPVCEGAPPAKAI